MNVKSSEVGRAAKLEANYYLPLDYTGNLKGIYYIDAMKLFTYSFNNKTVLALAALFLCALHLHSYQKTRYFQFLTFPMYS